MKNERLRAFLRMSRQKQIATVFAVWLVCFFLCLYILGSFSSIVKGDNSFTGAIAAGFTNAFTISFLLSTFLFAVLVMFIFFAKRNMRNTVESEKDGIFYANDKNSGASRWQTEDEIRSNFAVGKVEDLKGTIYGRLKTYGSDSVVTWKPSEMLTEAQKRRGMKQAPEGNRNVLVIATMGSGKTFTYVENELIQTVLRGDSFVVTDPKGEIFKNLTRFCQDRGVEVHTINLVEPEYSEFWNCLQETIDPETERLDSTRLDEFAMIYLDNAPSTDKHDFWYNCSLNLLKTAIGYVAWKKESQIIDRYINLYKHLSKVQNDTFASEAPTKQYSMPFFRQKIREAAAKNGYDVDEVNKIIEHIEKYGSEYKFNIGEVYNVLLDFKQKVLQDQTETQLLENIPSWHPASKAYKTFKINNSEQVIDSALQSTLLALAIFTNKSIQDTLSNDGMKLSDINSKQSGYIIITSDKPGNTAYKPVLSLFFSFFFKDTMDNYDKWEQICAENGGKNPCKGVTAMLEEFYSIGKINDFDTVMTTCRSRHIYVSIIIQHYKLLEELYGKNNKNTIDSACDTTYFLGANDLDTMKYVSQKTGNASILKESHHENSSFATRFDADVNVSTASRPLLTEEEVRMWSGKVLLIRRGMQPVELETFPWTDHWVMNNEKYVPGYIHMNGYSVAPDSAMPYRKFIAPLRERVEKIEKENAEHDNKNETIKITDEINKLSPLKESSIKVVRIISKETVSNQKENSKGKPVVNIVISESPHAGNNPAAQFFSKSESQNKNENVSTSENKANSSENNEKKNQIQHQNQKSKRDVTTGRNRRRGTGRNMAKDQKSRILDSNDFGD